MSPAMIWQPVAVDIGTDRKNETSVTSTAYPVIDLTEYKRQANADAASPFRYPGGKGFLAGYLEHEVNRRFASPPVFVEPYCGGAGAALNLLLKGAVESIILNDADMRIYSAWKAILHESERFIETIRKINICIDTWNTQLDLVCNSQKCGYNFDVGFATFFINRTSRSGVIVGSGPIGGYSQSGKWKIDARFNKETLIKRISRVASLKDRITLRNLDAIEFCRGLAEISPPEQTFLFIDPPYIGAGGRLYLDAMNEAKHIMLSDWIKSKTFKQWILTYDDHPLIRESYADHSPHHLTVNYSLAKKRSEKELIYIS